MVIEGINEKAHKFDAAEMNNTVLSAHVHTNVPERSRPGLQQTGWAGGEGQQRDWNDKGCGKGIFINSTGPPFNTG